MSATPVVNLELSISPRLLEKFETVLMGYSGAGGKLIHKKTRSKKSCDTVPLSSCKDAVQIQGLLLSRDKNRTSQNSFLRPVLWNYRHVMASNFTPPNFFFNMACFELFGGDHGNLATMHTYRREYWGAGGVGCPPAESLPPQSTLSSNGILPYVQSWG